MSLTLTPEVRYTGLHTEYAPVLLGYLAGFTGGNRPAAEDLLQETMIRAWCNLDGRARGSVGIRAGHRH